MKMVRGFAFLVIGCAWVSSSAWAQLADTIDKVKPSVVIVGIYKSTNSPRFALHGTGFVVRETAMVTSNLVVTNAHVLPGPLQVDPDASLVVQVRSGRDDLQMRQATVLEVDRVHDLALLRIEGQPVAGLSLGVSEQVREGQSFAFMGFPIGGVLGFSAVTHRASVSSITPASLPTPTAQQLNPLAIRSLRLGGGFDIFQLDGTAYPGNSGGPMFDPESGKVLGVINMVLLKGTRESALSHPSGISYAIPSRFVRELLERRQVK